VSITLLFFAAVRELVGEGERQLTVPPHVKTIGDLAEHLAHAIPALRGRLRAVRWARNEEIAELGDALREGDVVALIPPVAGG
jgi:molybdopterin synthase sulfur carrier subunit